ncbi:MULTISPECIES: addiction module protein [Pseudanabaena]|uniref:Addiction module protein n=2 Tax=Pseudanabaena TaxID=1152 RepID=A0A9X4RIX3_9CYAN|nr:MULTISPECIES: addiction module protein [Pseudanabaena]ELS32273.1 Putative addiction module component CHP02574 family protein [Pseudanabaena biceps PCC 7429]MDG3495480.1 addiction module protein [Pseudanabaena catenata USMAC16]
MRSIELLTKELLSLPSIARALLTEKLVESLEFDTDPTVQATWTAEAKKRRDAVRDGFVQTIDGEDALAQVRRLLA